MNDMKKPMPNEYAAAQAEYDKQGMMAMRKAKADAAAMGCGHSGKMSDEKYMHMQHEASESPKYEAMEEAGVKMLKSMKSMKGMKGSY